uniref:Nucleotidyl transferase AbiEii/AbiGii toxin family protein n=1 Tax=Rhodopseudomonas palustris (strain DX-1) TaxID=652103 RepID=E6VND0_RHOPX
MARPPVRNVAASARDRLANLARERKQPFELLLTRYVLERLLFRLSQTPHGSRFVLKGAMLLTTWLEAAFRPTRDLDLLGYGDPDPDAMLGVFTDVCAIDFDDGVVFDVAALEIDQIREELEYGGLRIKTNATVGGARVRVVVDIGFGDAVEPQAAEVDLPVLLDQPSPRIRTYPPETVIAEKFQAMVALGRANSRMKDFYDIWVLSRDYQFEGESLARAIAATFARRRTEIPTELPDALTKAFAEDAAKIKQWKAFMENIEVDVVPLADVVADLAAFLMPRAAQARGV